MQVGIITFPGTQNTSYLRSCLSKELGVETTLVNFYSEKLPDVDVVLLPGGSSFMDYLRPGALAKATPVAMALTRFVKKGGRAIGIGNGFQILCEMGLLPGALLPNSPAKFQSRLVMMRIEEELGERALGLTANQVYVVPFAGSSLRYFVSARALNEMEIQKQVLFRYCDDEGFTDFENCFNASVGAVAGVTNKVGNIIGIAPRIDRSLGKTTDGSQQIFKSLLFGSKTNAPVGESKEEDTL